MSKKIGNFAYWTDFISNYGHCRGSIYGGKQDSEINTFITVKQARLDHLKNKGDFVDYCM
ncbi:MULTISPECIES: hypothetical protein [Acinetobacter]|jgi:hypothetical protein|uniref:hypothetical protein n=1 Tax=Acinetobacter TaxID=469 RepID=UPI0003492423|nr:MULTISPECIES: hypothetical protein [Acinetobacter]MBI0394083.1 hypothetical protein [Acinetobacter bereziniae]MBJ8427192.1 hypothetical protein [Acinetobacter bereziniae]MBJ8452196.1 hypothetical protein [Acinetobacter bereziniae]MBJ8456176.1 hypothetical protein [Acinetobacter bereziniae]MBJ8476329.1 hypothetical protein [Acinetobacter bereziniae]